MQVSFTIKLDTNLNIQNLNAQKESINADSDMTIDEPHAIVTKVQESVINSTRAAQLIIPTEPL